MNQTEALQAALAGEPDLRLVTITVDPNYDTPERLTEYAKLYRAHPERWLFLTGDREAISSIWRAEQPRLLRVLRGEVPYSYEEYP